MKKRKEKEKKAKIKKAISTKTTGTKKRYFFLFNDGGRENKKARKT